MVRGKEDIHKELQKVERYEYYLIEYLKEMSNEITYLLVVVCALFLFILTDFMPSAQMEAFSFLRTIFIVIIIGCFALFGLSAVTKRRIEKKFKMSLR